MRGGYNFGEVRYQALAGAATRQVGAGRQWYGHKTFAFEDRGYFFTLHDRKLRKARTRDILLESRLRF
jgi:hypothetical protein